MSDSALSNPYESWDSYISGSHAVATVPSNSNLGPLNVKNCDPCGTSLCAFVWCMFSEPGRWWKWSRRFNASSRQCCWKPSAASLPPQQGPHVPSFLPPHVTAFTRFCCPTTIGFDQPRWLRACKEHVAKADLNGAFEDPGSF